MSKATATATREIIIEKAMSLFFENGYEGVSMQDIAWEVGITKGSLYHHFSGKEEIFSIVAYGVFQKIDIDLNTLRSDSLKHFIADIIARQREAVIAESEKNSPDMNSRNIYGILWDAFRLFPSFAKQVNARTQDREAT